MIVIVENDGHCPSMEQFEGDLGNELQLISVFEVIDFVTMDAKIDFYTNIFCGGIGEYIF